MMVKICGVTNREDALAAIDAGASAIGFNFYPRSPRYVTGEAAAEISAALPSSVCKVGVFVGETPERVSDTVRRAGLDVAQLHGAALYPPGIRVWQAVSAKPGFDAGSLDESGAEAILLDTPSDTLFGGTGETFDWSLAAGSAKKIIIAGGLDASNVRLAIERARPWGVDACSRIESAPGRKDHAKMAAFLKAALEEQL
jgi:phosphoribosylanthranilate isomerase